ncbi:MAG: glycosyltransferase family 2 protein [Deltaproteobacteria bacterium]|nr:glycosyltransferase family 2 protein [Deltaproteobacteria bacterium]
MTKTTISIIVPCLNEEGNVRGAVESIKTALAASRRFGAFEIIIFNDGSTDDTGAVIEGIRERDKSVRVVHNPRNMGFGYNYTEGVRLASNEYVIMVPGDNEIPAEALTRIMRLAGTADIIIPYTANQRARPPARRAISRLFVVIVNTLFGLSLRYYNGTCVIKGALLKRCPLKTWGFAYMAAILVRLLRTGATYAEVGIEIKPRDTGRSKAFAPKNVISVAKAIITLFWDVRVKERTRYSGHGQRVVVADSSASF